MDQTIDLQVACNKLNEILGESPHTASSLLNLNINVNHVEAHRSQIMCYPQGDAFVVNFLSLLSSLGDGSHIIVPAPSPHGALGVRLVPVNKEQEETK